MENMINIHNISGYGCNLWITPAMETFVKHIKEIGLHDLNFLVSLVPAEYDRTKAESRGPIGWIGPSRNDPGSPKINYNERYETLTCILKLSQAAESYIAELSDLANNIEVTRGGRNQRLAPLTIYPIFLYEKVIREHHLCKRTGFDEVLNSLKILLPDITEKDLATSDIGGKMMKIRNYHSCIEYNSAFIYDMEELKECDAKIMTIETSHDERKGIDYYNFKLEIMSVDIEKNTELLVQILKIAHNFILH